MCALAVMQPAVVRTHLYFLSLAPCVCHDCVCVCVYMTVGSLNVVQMLAARALRTVCGVTCKAVFSLMDRERTNATIVMIHGDTVERLI